LAEAPWSRSFRIFEAIRGVQCIQFVFAEAVYVLHVFQKKSKRGIATPRQDLDLIRRRLAEAERLHRERQN
jgi:phage-related protein